MTTTRTTRVRRSKRLERARRLVRTRLGTHEWSKQFELAGRRWVLLEGVFSPIDTPVTEMFTDWLPYPVGGSLLEIGCGTGVTSVQALLVGCDHVVAVDINDKAVENTRLNAQRHGVSNRISVRHGDLFEALEPDERFDLIYWNSNFIDVPHDHVFETELDYAYFDPGYLVHRRYLRGAASHLNSAGRLFLGFSSLGNWAELRRACSEAGLEPTVVRSELKDPHSTVEFQIARAQGRARGLTTPAARTRVVRCDIAVRVMCRVAPARYAILPVWQTPSPRGSPRCATTSARWSGGSTPRPRSSRPGESETAPTA